MTHDLIEPGIKPALLYSAFFEALPGNCLLLQNDGPEFTILAVTEQHLKDTGMRKDLLIGKSLFKAYPANPDDENDTGENNLRTSLEYVLLHKVSHKLPIQRYDVVSEEGRYS